MDRVKEKQEIAKAIMSVESKTHGVSHYVGAGMAMQIADKIQELGYCKAADVSKATALEIINRLSREEYYFGKYLKDILENIANDYGVEL